MYRRLLSSTVLALLYVAAPSAAQLPADTSSHRSAFVSVEGVRVHYLDWGGSGPAMLFVPGAGHTAHVFDDFAPRFVDDYRVVAITRVGSGESDMPSGAGYSLTERVAQMRAVLDSLDLTNAVLVGHSLGGDEITGFAAEYPERVIAVIYLDAAYDHVQAFQWESALRASIGAGPPVPTGEDLGTVAGYQRYLARLGGVTLPLGEVLASYRFDSAGAYAGPRSPRRVRQEMEAATEPPDFAGVHAPALAIYSDHRVPQDLAPWLPDDSTTVAVFEDALDQTAAERERIAAAFPRLTVVMRRSHHYQFLSEPDWTEATIRSFLAGLALGAQAPRGEPDAVPGASDAFETIAASAVVIEGESNQLELQSADDAVRDMGTASRVTRAAGVPSESDAPVGQAPQAATSQEWIDRSPHETRFVTVAPDVRLEVLDWGGDGIPLVFLAGANFNAHSFDDFAPRFTDTHRVLGITRRGHGNSSWPDAGYDLPTLVEDVRVVLDSLGIERAILAGHSMAGSEMTVLATEYPDRIAGLIYIDAGHDPTDIGRLRVPELCSFGPGFLEAMERTFENPELVRRTQWYTDENGARRPFVSSVGARIDLPTPDYSGVVAPALGIYYVPERTEDVFMGVGDPSPGCVAAFHRYIHGGMAAFTEGFEQATVVALSDTNHNIHLTSPAALEAVMRTWLASHAASDPTDRLVREHMEALGIPAVSLVVMRNGVVLREAAYGRPSLELDVPATPATVFPYASMAKVFTGTAVLRLVQDGRLSLEGHIADLLPDLPPAWSDVTVRQLLAHTSGLPDLNSERGFQNPFVSPWASVAAALDTLAGLPVERAPGTGFSYNQTNYLLLGMLLERIDGRTVEEYVAEEFAGPLGLASLAYGDSRVPIAGRASWYTRMDFSEGEPRVVAPRPLWIEYPHFLHTGAGLNGTARDLAGFVDAVASGRLLDDAHRHEMWTALPLADGSTFRFEDGVTGSGLGWWVHDDPTHPWVGMGGAASGVVRHHVNEGLTIAVLTNLQGAMPEALASRIAEIYLRVDTVQVPPPIGESAADRASILSALRSVRPGGTVQFAPGLYLMGELVRVPTPGITLLGHPEGTVLRGCGPTEYDARTRSRQGHGSGGSLRALQPVHSPFRSRCARWSNRAISSGSSGTVSDQVVAELERIGG